MTSARAPLYTPEMLAAAWRLSEHHLDEVAERPGARTASDSARPCGSRITVALILSPGGLVDRIGVRVSACAVGQAATAVALSAAHGRDAAALGAIDAGVARWLADPDAPAPDVADFALLTPARAVIGRHGAIRLPFRVIAAAARAGSPE